MNVPAVPSDVLTVLSFAAIPALAIVAGGALATVRPPGAKAKSIIQHFAAGVVFAAVAVELIPEITAEAHLGALAVGFLCGLGAMLAVNRISLLDAGGDRDAAGRPPRGLLTGVAVDVFVDGLLVGTSFVAGARTGMLITAALTLELLFLGLAAAAAMRGSGRTSRSVLTASLLLALVVLVGAGLGSTLLAGLSGAPLVGVLSFATAALLYLVTEELLGEAHNIPDTALATAMFFLGFLCLLVLEIVSR